MSRGGEEELFCSRARLDGPPRHRSELREQTSPLANHRFCLATSTDFCPSTVIQIKDSLLLDLGNGGAA